ncbi:DUF5753 domain-containing protein [Actinomadura sp. 9N407]|uniref:DUF5753 domain-containing protein n=1 Tax=Actinomadura sp. 9N407 TaxID=3375154 RepID=UPI0037907334
MPGLFRIPDYTCALLSASRMVNDIEAAVEARMMRQEVLARQDPPLVWGLIDESVLYRQIGSTGVMYKQLDRLREAVEMPHVMIRVVPHAAGFYLSLEGSFNSLSLETGELAFVEAPGGGRLIQGSTEVSEFRVRWDRIGASALPWDSSRDLIAQAIKRFS